MTEEFSRFEFVSSGNCKMSAISLGDSNKPAVILLHGMRDHALSLLSAAKMLAADYYVIAPDLRGHGQSDNPGAYTLFQFVADVNALIRFKNLAQVTLIGHSLGGHVAARYAAIYSDQVRALALLDGMGPPDISDEAGETVNMDGDVTMVLARARADIDWLNSGTANNRSMPSLEFAVSRLVKNNPRLDPQRATLLTEHGVEPHPDGGLRWRFDPAVGMIWHSFAHEDTDPIWQSIKCPVLIVTGDEALDYWSQMRVAYKGREQEYEVCLKHREALFEQGQHHVIPQAGHMLQYDQPEVLNRLLKQFLSENSL